MVLNISSGKIIDKRVITKKKLFFNWNGLRRKVGQINWNEESNTCFDGCYLLYYIAFRYYICFLLLRFEFVYIILLNSLGYKTIKILILCNDWIWYDCVVIFSSFFDNIINLFLKLLICIIIYIATKNNIVYPNIFKNNTT